jgi:hypothetical protein
VCLCKTCDTVEITTWGDTPNYQAVYLCQCCGGLRYEHYSWEVSQCPNRKPRPQTSAG